MSGQNMPEIVGNAQLRADLQTMRRGNHLPHALLLHGERGCGKKLLAKWFAMLVLCEHPEQAPCGQCRACRLVQEDAHPDVMWAEHSGKRMGFTVDTVREIRREAAVLPNNGEMRVFLFADADGMSIQAQNALLKSVEEPPAHSCFVFTTETVGALLPTLLSRMTAKAVFPVSEGECVAALTRLSYPADDVQAAVSRFGGNIGRCIAYLSDEMQRKAAETAAALTAALAQVDEYTLLQLLTAAAADKDLLRRTLELLDMQIRDAAVFSLNGEFRRLGCDRAAAEALSARLSPRRAMRMHGAITEAFADLESNVGAVLTATALCAALSAQ
ncbi:MAG: AAA family ATPase [Oscillospiraceae bacterium]|nr:AAA family ATPase [Oscillospiraceae bacterium]